MPEKTYNRRAHSVCCLTYHAVFVIKYRRKVISPEIMDFMENHTKYLMKNGLTENCLDLMEKKTIFTSYLSFHRLPLRQSLSAI